jgi:hypothetical protein
MLSCEPEWTVVVDAPASKVLIVPGNLPAVPRYTRYLVLNKE